MFHLYRSKCSQHRSILCRNHPGSPETVYDQYDIAHDVKTIHVLRQQTYDQYDIAHYVESIPVFREHT